MRALGFQVKKADVRKLIADVDKEDSGLIGYDDFVELMTGRMVRLSRERGKLRLGHVRAPSYVHPTPTLAFCFAGGAGQQGGDRQGLFAV